MTPAKSSGPPLLCRFSCLSVSRDDPAQNAKKENPVKNVSYKKHQDDIIILNTGASHHFHQFIPGPNKLSVKVSCLYQE